MSKLGRKTRFTWLGHATFLIEAPGGERILIDPWLAGNPRCPEEYHRISDLDAILVTHGHFDHVGDVVETARRTGAQVVCNFEIGHWLESKEVENVVAMNKGGTVEVCHARVTMTHAFHSSGILDGNRIIYGGEPGSFVVEMANGFRFFAAGDTCLFGDMKLIGELYGPELAILPIGDHFTMDPAQAARAAEMLGVRGVIPMHYGTFDLLHGTPGQLKEALGDREIEVHVLAPGETLE